MPSPPALQVRTDQVDGFLLDRGFQIFLTSYPEAQASMHLLSLDRMVACWATAACRSATPKRRLARRHDGCCGLQHPLPLTMLSFPPSNLVSYHRHNVEAQSAGCPTPHALLCRPPG